MQQRLPSSKSENNEKVEHHPPSQSAHFLLGHGDELVATAAWPRWPGAILLGTPLLVSGYVFGFRGATFEGFLTAGDRFVRGVLERVTNEYLLGFITILIVGILATALYASIASLLNTSRIYIAQSNLIVVTSPVPLFRRQRRYALCDIISVSARKHGTMDGKHEAHDVLLNKQFALVVRLRGREPQTALWNLGEKEQAMRVARAINERIDALKSTSAANVEKDERTND